MPKTTPVFNEIRRNVTGIDLSGLATNTTLSVESWALNVERSFDPAGRLSLQLMNSRTDELTNFSAFSYSYCGWSGLLSSVSNAVLTAEYASDILDRVTNITYRTAGGGVIQSFSYAYDLSGLITQQVAVAQASALATNSYAYDGLGRLVSERIQNSGTSELSNLSYDLAGNRLSVSSAVSVVNNSYTNNCLTAASDGTALAYDAAGNVTSIVSVSSVRALVWNGQRQLVSVSTNGAFAESYAYDALGRRISTTDSGGTVYHVYDGDECVADVDASGNPLRVYTWGPGIDDLLAVTVYGETATNTYYAVKDHLGSVHALVDVSGNTAASYTYDAWGVVSATIPNSSFLTPHSLRFLFQGREYSCATGLYNFRARWYAPEFGRWLSNDPIGISGGLNLYAFCGNNPVNYTDPFGLKADLNLFPLNQKAHDYANKASTQDGSFLVSGHGLPGLVFDQNGKAIPIPDLAQQIVDSKTYTPGQTVTIAVCYGGAEADGNGKSSAETLADELYKLTGVKTKVNGCDGILDYWRAGPVTPQIGAKWHQFPKKTTSGDVSTK